MGRPKLILRVGGRSVIARVVGALREGGADRVVVVAPPRGAEGADELIREAEEAGAAVVVAETRPSDRRASVALGLSHLGRGEGPWGLLLAPGDCAGLTAGTVARVIDCGREHPGRVVVPVYEGRRGHPLLLPWAIAGEVEGLPAGLGIDALRDRHAEGLIEVEVEDAGAIADLDTPEDYGRFGVE